jgi:hypothetical protein
MSQGLLGMLRPQADTRGRGCWNALHHNWGRVTILAGMGNAVLGALLIHDLKDESYLNWLLPACVLIGLVAITAIALEAFKLQVWGGGRCLCEGWTTFFRGSFDLTLYIQN